MSFSHGPRLVKTCLWTYADSERPDQPAHPRSLIRAFTLRCEIHWKKEWIKGARMRPCVCARWRESAHFAHARRHAFAWQGPYSMSIAKVLYRICRQGGSIRIRIVRSDPPCPSIYATSVYVQRLFKQTADARRTVHRLIRISAVRICQYTMFHKTWITWIRT